MREEVRHQGFGMVRTGYLGLGSNVGDSAGHLRAAIELLGERGIEVEAVSSAYRTEPVGEVLDQPDFLNAAVRVRTALEPEALLDACKAVEAERGRSLDAPRHSPRPLDVDLLLLGDLALETPSLTLPHPEVTTRRFVLVPLLDLDPQLTLPDGTRLADALATLPEGQRVEQVGRLQRLPDLDRREPENEER
jgi:2-amino-4-hydroxy-6-hydroxymethyldihydropteridine diphosphokinase